MSGNNDQRALLEWIVAGLAIPEVRQLHGDGGYLLSNMIGKYSLAADMYALSVGALAELSKSDFDIKQTYSRHRFYGKGKPFIYEHPIPKAVVRTALLSSDGAYESVREILEQAGPVAMILRVEDDQLSSNGLSRKMPKGWKWGDDPFARYRAAGIQLSNGQLKIQGNLYV